MFTRALVRPPAESLALGLTSAALGPPDVALALRQHARYAAALRACGLEVVELAAEPAFPDSTFVEDTAVLLSGRAVITRPGAPSRAGEVVSMRAALRPFFAHLAEIEAPGTLDGGDVCAAGEHVFIGLSARTNDEGGRQLARLLAAAGFTSSLIDVRPIPGLLHLKSGLAWVGERRLVALDALRVHPALRGWTTIPVARGEEYGANCVCLGRHVLVPAAHPALSSHLRKLDLEPVELDVSEFRKLDGGLSCLSLRF